jgi:hypothetical protein
VCVFGGSRARWYQICCAGLATLPPALILYFVVSINILRYRTPDYDSILSLPCWIDPNGWNGTKSQAPFNLAP